MGELSLLLPEKRELCFSVLDFWGSRQVGARRGWLAQGFARTVDRTTASPWSLTFRVGSVRNNNPDSHTQDNVVLLSALDAPFRNRSIAEVKELVRHVLMPLKIKDGQEYYISMGHGIVKDEQVGEALAEQLPWIKACYSHADYTHGIVIRSYRREGCRGAPHKPSS